MYDQLEIELKNRLNAKFLEKNLQNLIVAEVMPENAAEYKPAFPKSRITVQYSGSTFSKPSSTNQVAQTETLIFRFSMEATNLRGDNGIYKIMTYLKRFLLGYKPSGCSNRLYVSKYDLIEVDQNAWQPYLEFSCDTRLMQEDVDEESLLELVENDFGNDFGSEFDAIEGLKNTTFK